MAHFDGETACERILYNLLKSEGFEVSKKQKFSYTNKTGRTSYITVDLAIPSAKLAIEVDGGYHKHTQENDNKRQMTIQKHNWRYVRFTNKQVNYDPEQVVKDVKYLIGHPNKKSNKKEKPHVKKYGHRDPYETEEEDVWVDVTDLFVDVFRTIWNGIKTIFKGISVIHNFLLDTPIIGTIYIYAIILLVFLFLLFLLFMGIGLNL